MSSEIRVLHVDDEPVIGDVTRRSLEREGKFKVDYVSSAGEALERMKECSYSCIISDYEMPEMNGLDFLKHIRLIDPDLPFILLSGRGREMMITDAINNGADFFIQKGGDVRSLFAELSHKVEYAVQKRNARIALRRRDAILEAISLVGNLFLSGDLFENALREAITLFGLSTEVDEVRILKYENGENTEPLFSQLYMWSRIQDGGEWKIQPVVLMNGDLGEERWERIRRGEPVFYSSQETPGELSVYSRMHIRSMAAFPIFAEKRLWGLIWFADCLSSRIWPEIEVDALLTASAIIGSAVQQNLMKNRLIEAQHQFEMMYHRMRQLCDTVPDLLWAEDTFGDITFTNRSVSGRHQILENLRCGLKGSYLGDRTSNIEITPSMHSEMYRADITLRNGETFSVYDLIQVPFRDNLGDITGNVSVARDVTEERMAVRELARNKKRLQAIFQNIHLGLITVTEDGIVTSINRRATGLIHKNPDDIVGKAISQVHPVLQKTWDIHLSDPMRNIPHRIQDDNGVSLYFGYFPLQNTEGEINEYLITLDEDYS